MLGGTRAEKRLGTAALNEEDFVLGVCVDYTIPRMTFGLCQWTKVRPQSMEPEICFITNGKI